MVSREALKAQMVGFVQSNPTQVRRNGQSYHQTEVFTACALKLALREYRKLEFADQTAVLLRDSMISLIRRYQDYCIKDHFGAHYREVGLKHNTRTELEHVVPLAVAVGMLIHGKLTIAQAMNVPTCVLSKRNHKLLNKGALVKTTPDPYNFWQRYSGLNVKIESHNGTAIDTNTWTMWDHYDYFHIAD